MPGEPDREQEPLARHALHMQVEELSAQILELEERRDLLQQAHKTERSILYIYNRQYISEIDISQLLISIYYPSLTKI